MTDQSGPLAIYGPMQERGFRLGLEYATDGSLAVAGHPLQISVKDNGSDPETAVTQARELIEAEGARILVGTVSSGATMAVAEVAKENEVILIAEPAASPAITGGNFNPYTFRTQPKQCPGCANHDVVSDGYRRDLRSDRAGLRLRLWFGRRLLRICEGAGR